MSKYGLDVQFSGNRRLCRVPEQPRRRFKEEIKGKIPVPGGWGTWSADFPHFSPPSPRGPTFNKLSIFWPSKKSSNTRPLKKSTFGPDLGRFRIFSTALSPFWFYFGVPRRSFFDCFGRSILRSLFHRVFKENVKNKKTTKVRLDL